MDSKGYMRHLPLIFGLTLGMSVTNHLFAATLAKVVSDRSLFWPRAGFIADSSGNLYSTSYFGGGGLGNVYEYAPATGSLTTLGSLGGDNGDAIQSGVTFDSSGNLYGTAVYGGAYGNNGTIFTYDTTAMGSLRVLVSFDGDNGANPRTSLIAGSSGALYGTTSAGGENGYGTIFEYDTIANSLTTLASFNGANGSNPSGLLADSSGNFYGTTEYGGTGGPDANGTIFKYDSSTKSLVTLASFNGDNGAEPLDSLIADSSGNLYGTTEGGGINGFGTIFEYVASTGSIITLAPFDNNNGAGPVGGLITDATGNLFGTTSGGGTSNDGTVFEYDAATGSLLTLLSFDDTNGYRPEGALYADSLGNLYGTTQDTIFELTDTGFVVPEPIGLGLVGLGVAIGFNRASRCRRR